MKYKYIKGLIAGALILLSAGVNGETISGIVKDKSGLPVKGAKIVLLGNYKVQAVTNDEGQFSIEANIGDYIKTETPDNKMQLDVISESGIVVNIDDRSSFINMANGNKVRLLENTAAVSTITSNDIMKSSALSPSNALYGLGLGLTVLQNNDDPWTNAPTMYVRGIGSLYGVSPLILVDGFERPMNMLSKDEIDNIQILKDAAATAIYGLRGSNGVISVTTKKGIYNGRKVSVSYDQAFNKAVRLPKFVNAQTYARSVNEAMVNDKALGTRYNDYEISAFGSGTSPYYADVDWSDQLLRNTGTSNIINASFSGGGSTARYFSSINLTNNSGFIKPDNLVSQFSSQLKYQQFNARTNLDIDITPTTELTVRLMGALQAYNTPTRSGQGVMSLIYNTPSAAFPIKTPSGKYGTSSTWTKNPLAEITAQGFSGVSTRTLLADLGITQHLDAVLKGLSASARIGLDTYAAYMEGQNQGYESEINTVLFDASGNPSSVTTSIVGKNTTPNRYKYLGSQWQTYNFVGQADYENTFEKSNIKASLIAAVNQSVNPGQYNTYNRLRLAAYMHYGYDDKYFVDGVFTINGSNLLPRSNRYGYFPSLSAGWIVSNEAFLKDVKVVNLLKIRASAGITGNDMLPSGAHNLENQYFGGKGGAIFGDSYSGYGGLGELRLQSSNLTYEKTYKYNVGVDASLLDMFDVTVDLFMHKTRDILVNTSGTTSAVLGLTPDYYNLDQFLPYENIGAVDNKGIELGLNFHKTINELTVSAGGNFTFTRNKIIEMGEGYYPNGAAKQTGKSVGQPIGYQVLGLFKDAAEIAGSPTQILYPVVPGDFKYANTYGNDAIVDSYDRVALGYSTLIPEINYSFNVGAEYKGFGIDAMFQGVGNYSAYLLNNSQYKPLVNNGNLSQLYYENRWTADNLDAKYPRLTANTNENNYVVNSTWIADASFLKLRHCEVYYKMPQSWISSVKLEAVKLYLRGTDLLTIDKIKDVDPESFRTGSLYPSISSVNIGAKIDF